MAKKSSSFFRGWLRSEWEVAVQLYFMKSGIRQQIISLALYALRFAFLFLLGLATSRLLYEWIFPHWLEMARPFPTLLLSFFLASALLALCRITLPTLPTLLLSPLLLNLIYLFDPAVNLTQSRFLFFASLWLTAVLISHHYHIIRLFPWFGLTFILAGLLPVYLLTMPHTVGRADTFEFQVVAPQLAIAHPTGYPLYLLLAKLFTFVPISSVAWRINLASAVFALAALTIIYLIILQLDYQPIPALLGAIAIGLTPTFWSQAIEAEVYALQALITAVSLWFILEIGEWRVASGEWRFALILAAIIGLGLTNHLTTLFLIPAATLAFLFTLYKYGPPLAAYRLLITDSWLLPKLLLATITPLALYAYLPIRWAATNEDRMGFGRFVEWVIGGRFQGALQWSAWRTDFTRYEVVGRLFLDNWETFNLILAGIGLGYLLYRRWRTAVLLFITWFGFSFYALSYYVPDISVFLIPSQIIIGIYWAAGVMGVLDISKWAIERVEIMNLRLSFTLQSPVSSLLFVSILLLAIAHWPQLDRSAEDGLTQWGTAVLNLPLAQNAAILADSEKIAPLYYLQQAEGVRPDLDIMVLPDEAAYRAQLNGRIAHQTIYLARFLPGLEGIYHLRSVGPLTEVSPKPLTQLPGQATPTERNFGEIDLIGYEVGKTFESGKTAVTLYWQANQTITQPQHIYLRWANTSITTSGQHPANNNYPTNAWQVGEIVPDFHLVLNPISTGPQQRALQVALAPPFTPVSQLNWKIVDVIDILAHDQITNLRPYRIQINSSTISGMQFSPTVRPQTPLDLTIVGFGRPEEIRYELSATPPQPVPIQKYRLTIDNYPPFLDPYIAQTALDTNSDNDRYHLIAHSENGAICGWLQPATTSCNLGQIEISGIPLAANATNYDDKIALLTLDLPQTQLQAGGQLPLTLTWQSLSRTNKDYTIFIQILDAQDQIVGQIDAWPLQGTLPTSQWDAGEIITDPYVIQLSNNLPSGNYRLLIGWYLLADASRLSVLNSVGNPIDDKLVIPDLFVP